MGFGIGGIIMRKHRQEVTAVVEAVWREILGLVETDAEGDFIVLGGTSIAAEQIASRIGERLDIIIQGSDVLRSSTLEGLVDLVITRKEASLEATPACV
jgi:acyl carrier protein